MDKNISTYYGGKYNTYVGARYVPIFAEPVEWDKNRTYEPLTIVTYQGNSYTSKTFVPANIKINDEQFWVLTSNFNAQVEAYRKEVTELNEEVDNISKQVDSSTSLVNNLNQDVTKLKNDVTELNESVQTLENAKSLIQSPRIKKIWYTDNEVRAIVPEMYLNGFRFLGTYLKPSSKKYVPSSVYLDFHNVNDLKYINRANACWVFNCIYLEGSRVKKAVIPFFEVKSITQNNITLAPISFGGIYDSYHGNPDFSSVNNCDLLQVHKAGRFDGKIVKALSGTENTITVDDASNLTIGDFVAISPTSDDYLYLHSYYVDQANGVLNFGDDGRMNVIYGIYKESILQKGNNTIDVSKMVSPLCTAVNISANVINRTSESGTIVIRMGSDVSHTPYSWLLEKKSGESRSLTTDLVWIPMMHGQSIGVKVELIGGINTISSSRCTFSGYLEP